MPIEYTAIGLYHSTHRYKFEAPRQGVLAEGSGEVRLRSGQNFEQALTDLDGFERIWVIYDFHLNKNWKPKTAPPVSGRKKKVGLFASRSPYRPNSIGLSCVRLEQIKGLSLFVSECDLLDGTPVLDIKPYLPYADAFPQAAVGWPAEQSAVQYKITVEPKAQNQIDFAGEHTGLDVIAFLNTQLSVRPADTKKKRIEVLDNAAGRFQIAYRTWRILYRINDLTKQIVIEGVASGYSQQELSAVDDPYHDKEAHRLFLAKNWL